MKPIQIEVTIIAGDFYTKSVYIMTVPDEHAYVDNKLSENNIERWLNLYIYDNWAWQTIKRKYWRLIK